MIEILRHAQQHNYCNTLDRPDEARGPVRGFTRDQIRLFDMIEGLLDLRLL